MLRTNVLAVAMKLFASRPHTEVSLAELANEANVSISGIQRTFLSKDQILAAVVIESSTQIFKGHRNLLLSMDQNEGPKHITVLLSYARLILDWALRRGSHEWCCVINMFEGAGRDLNLRKNLPDIQFLDTYFYAFPIEKRQIVKCFFFGALGEYVRNAQQDCATAQNDTHQALEMIHAFLISSGTEKSSLTGKPEFVTADNLRLLVVMARKFADAGDLVLSD